MLQWPIIFISLYFCWNKFTIVAYQEIYAPECDKLSYITDRSCSVEQICEMELQIMKVCLEVYLMFFFEISFQKNTQNICCTV